MKYTHRTMHKTVHGFVHSHIPKGVNPKRNQSWIFTGRTDTEAEAPILWPLDVKNWLIGKHPDAEKDRRSEEKGITEDEMVGCHHWLNGHEFEQALGVGDGLGRLVCFSPQGRKELDTTSDWTELMKLQWDFPAGSVVKQPPANARDAVRSLGWECPLREEKTTACFSILAWEMPWTGAWQATVHGVTTEGYMTEHKTPVESSISISSGHNCRWLHL